jgi:hypothetical protein
MIFYSVVMFLSHTFSITNSGVEFVIIIFNENPWKKLYIITIYKPPQMLFLFIYIFKNIMKYAYQFSTHNNQRF